MAETTRPAGTGASVTGIGSYTWTNPGNITTLNASFATCNTPTRYLRASNFGFSIPSVDTINGVVVSVYRKASVINFLYDAEVKLVNNSGTIVGNNKAKASSVYWQYGSVETVNYGANNDTWGVSLTPTIINDVDFGVVIAAKEDSGSSYTAYVDYITITIYHTPPYTALAATISQACSIVAAFTIIRLFATAISQTVSLSAWIRLPIWIQSALSQSTSIAANLRLSIQMVVDMIQTVSVSASMKFSAVLQIVIQQVISSNPYLNTILYFQSVISPIVNIVANLKTLWNRNDPANTNWTNKSNNSNWTDININDSDWYDS